jgi:gas vesicle protein
VTAAFGLAGALIGGLIAGTASLLVARQAREAAEKAWIRDSRREIYDRFLTNAQKLLIACEATKNGYGNEEAEETEAALEAAHIDFFEVYVVVQTVAERPVVDAARVYAYRLLA